MKKFFLITIVALAACHGRQNTITTKNPDGSTTTTSFDVKSMTSTTDEMNKKMEELKKLTPLSLDQLIGMLPAELNGIKQSNYEANSSLGYSIADAEYKKDDTTILKVTI